MRGWEERAVALNPALSAPLWPGPLFIIFHDISILIVSQLLMQQHVWRSLREHALATFVTDMYGVGK